MGSLDKTIQERVYVVPDMALNGKSMKALRISYVAFGQGLGQTELSLVLDSSNGWSFPTGWSELAGHGMPAFPGSQIVPTFYGSAAVQSE